MLGLQKEKRQHALRFPLRGIDIAANLPTIFNFRRHTGTGFHIIAPQRPSHSDTFERLQRRFAAI
jgi:hypothetical protein